MKLIALDLDGTLFNNQSRISEENIQTISIKLTMPIRNIKTHSQKVMKKLPTKTKLIHYKAIIKVYRNKVKL